MAKRARKKKVAPIRRAADAPVKLTDNDKKTLKSIVGMGDRVVKIAGLSRAPHLDIPSRSLSNV